MSVSFPGQALPNLLCRDFPVPLEQGAGHALTRFSHFLCWFQSFSDRFAFYSRGGERSDNSEVQKRCHLFLSKHQKKVIASSWTISLPHTSQAEGCSFLESGKLEGTKKCRWVHPLTKLSHLSQDTFQSNYHRPQRVSSLFKLYSKESSSFSYSESFKTCFVSPTPISCNTTYNNI